jgi:hypothetical protein
MIVDPNDMDLNVERTYLVSGIGKLGFYSKFIIEHSKSKLVVDPKTN